MTVWWGVVASAAMPRGVIERLNRDINAALATPELKKRLDDMGARERDEAPVHPMS